MDSTFRANEVFIPVVFLEAGASETLVCSRAKRAQSELEGIDLVAFCPLRLNQGVVYAPPTLACRIGLGEKPAMEPKFAACSLVVPEKRPLQNRWRSGDGPEPRHLPVGYKISDSGILVYAYCTCTGRSIGNL